MNQLMTKCKSCLAIFRAFNKYAVHCDELTFSCNLCGNERRLYSDNGKTIVGRNEWKLIPPHEGFPACDSDFCYLKNADFRERAGKLAEDRFTNGDNTFCYFCMQNVCRSIAEAENDW